MRGKSYLLLSANKQLAHLRFSNQWCVLPSSGFSTAQLSEEVSMTGEEGQMRKEFSNILTKMYFSVTLKNTKHTNNYFK